MQNKVRRAVTKAGGLTATANGMEVSAVTVFRWIKNGRVPNIAKARQLSILSGVSVEDLRPTGSESPDVLEAAA